MRQINALSSPLSRRITLHVAWDYLPNQNERRSLGLHRCFQQSVFRQPMFLAMALALLSATTANTVASPSAVSTRRGWEDESKSDSNCVAEHRRTITGRLVV